MRKQGNKCKKHIQINHKHNIIYNKMEQQEELNTTNVNISTNNAKDWHRVEKSVQKAEQWGCRSLYLTNTCCDEILHHIHHINFTSLIKIVLWNNEITTMECLLTIEMPHIKQLNIASNLLVSFRLLRKGVYRSLIKLVLGNNVLIDGMVLPALHAPLRMISLTLAYEDDKSPIVCWLGKMESNSMEKIWLQSQKKIPQPRLYFAIDERYKKKVMQTDSSDPATDSPVQ